MNFDYDFHPAKAAVTIDQELVLKWVRKSFWPDEVFNLKQLEAWAKENGYTKGATL